MFATKYCLVLHIKYDMILGGFGFFCLVFSLASLQIPRHLVCALKLLVRRQTKKKVKARHVLESLDADGADVTTLDAEDDLHNVPCAVGVKGGQE